MFLKKTLLPVLESTLFILKLFYDGLHPDAAWASKAQMSHAEMNTTVPSDGLFLSDFTVWQEITNI